MAAPAVTYSDLRTEAGAKALNAAVPRAKPKCKVCNGTGHYYVPSLIQQNAEVKAGTREFTVGRTCECIRG